MNDPIDRQAAIDAMKSISDSICEQQAIDALCELPSAQPEPPTDDCISREEAIGIVAPYDEGREMRDALEDLPPAYPDVPDTNAGDLISREAMGDALNRMRVGNNETWYSFYQKALDELCKLPSAQPEHDENDLDFVQPHKRIPVQLVVSSDCISRQAAIDALKNRWKKTRNYEGNGDDIAEECELYLKQVPSAQLDIIHCGECRHFTIKGNIERVEFGKCSVIKSVCLREDYCSWAERKEGDADG